MQPAAEVLIALDRHVSYDALEIALVEVSHGDALVRAGDSGYYDQRGRSDLAFLSQGAAQSVLIRTRLVRVHASFSTRLSEGGWNAVVFASDRWDAFAADHSTYMTLAILITQMTLVVRTSLATQMTLVVCISLATQMTLVVCTLLMVYCSRAGYPDFELISLFPGISAQPLSVAHMTPGTAGAGASSPVNLLFYQVPSDVKDKKCKLNLEFDRSEF